MKPCAPTVGRLHAPIQGRWLVPQRPHFDRPPPGFEAFGVLERRLWSRLIVRLLSVCAYTLRNRGQSLLLGALLRPGRKRYSPDLFRPQQQCLRYLAVALVPAFPAIDEPVGPMPLRL